MMSSQLVGVAAQHTTAAISLSDFSFDFGGEIFISSSIVTSICWVVRACKPHGVPNFIASTRAGGFFGI